MKQKFDWNISTEEIEEVLKGTYNNQEDADLTEIMELILTNCVQTAPSKETNAAITVTQLRREMKVWRESTTTSPSGRHLGHYKSLFTVIDKSNHLNQKRGKN